MHELAITQSIVDAVAERAGDARVVRVVVEIGRLTGVVADSVRFCFDLCAEATTLAGAALQIIESPGRARCGECRAEFDLEGPLALCSCGSASLEILSGEQLRIREVELQDV